MTGKINIKDMLKELFLGLSAIASFFILCIPFGVEEVISHNILILLDLINIVLLMLLIYGTFG